MLNSFVRRSAPLAKKTWTSATTGQMRSFAAGVESKVKELKTQEEFRAAKAALGENGAAIFDFTAVWCGPCKMISPVYEQLASDLPDVAFYKLDIDNPDLIEAITDANISSVPTFIGYKGGRYVGEFTGADRTKLATLLAKVSS